MSGQSSRKPRATETEIREGKFATPQLIESSSVLCTEEIFAAR